MPAELPHPVEVSSLTAETQMWVAAPDVLADPAQVQDGRVWTRAQDVLPGRRVTPGQPLVAAWADQTFRARAEWDDTEIDHLWLRPITAPSGRPEVDRRQLREAVRAATTPGGSATALVALVADLADAFDRAIEALASSRSTAREVVRLLDAVQDRHHPRPDKPEADLAEQAAVVALQWHARRPLRHRP